MAAKKSKRAPPKKQAKKPTKKRVSRQPSLKELRDEEAKLKARLAAVRKLRKAQSRDSAKATRERERIAQRRARQLDKELKAERRERAQFEKELIATLRDMGLYNPKGKKITAAQRKRANSLYSKYKDLIDPDRYFQKRIPNEIARDKKKLRDFLAKAKNAGFKTSNKVVFYAKENYHSARWEYDKDLQTWTIVRKRRTKKGKHPGTVQEDKVPIAGIDELARQEDKLRRKAKRLGALKKGQVFTFMVEGNMSRRNFDNIELLLKFLETYRKETPRKVEFLTNIVIRKMSNSAWVKERRKRDRSLEKFKRARRGLRVNKTGRSR